MTRRASSLAEDIGLGCDDVEKALKEDILSAADVVAEEFRRILIDLQAHSDSGAFTNYEVVVETEPYTKRIAMCGSLNLIRCHIYVKSPDPKINVFDIIDSGRKGMPKGGLYPLWGIRGERLVTKKGKGNQRRDEHGRFTLTKASGGSKGVRPEELRWKLVGPYNKNSQYKPYRFTQGPISPVPAAKLYERVYNIAKKKLRQQGFSLYDLLLVKAKD